MAEPTRSRRAARRPCDQERWRWCWLHFEERYTYRGFAALLVDFRGWRP